LSEATDTLEGAGARRRSALWQRLLPWIIALGCFAYLYRRLSAAAGPEQTLVTYLADIFASVSWGRWLALMIPYSAFFFLIDSLIVWRVVNWFNTQVRYVDILPIRGSSYILSIINEQVGKGAMGLYLYRRHAVPGWEVGSSMLFIMFCEFYYLLSWASVGYAISHSSLPDVFSFIPSILVVALIFFAGFALFFSGRLAIGQRLRDRPILSAFRQAKVWQYVYAAAAGFFGIEVDTAAMLGYAPVVFFGAATPGPMRSVAITLWVVLFPEHPGEAAAFGFVQHNFFIFFNASIGMLFLRRANRELFGDAPARAADPR
jgi:hypothetical protein